MCPGREVSLRARASRVRGERARARHLGYLGRLQQNLITLLQSEYFDADKLFSTISTRPQLLITISSHFPDGETSSCENLLK